MNMINYPDKNIPFGQPPVQVSFGRASNGPRVRGGRGGEERGRTGPNSGNSPLQNHSRCMVFCYTTSCDQMWNQTVKKTKQSDE